MRNNGIALNKVELQGLVSRLDRDWDGRVSYDEFKEIFYLISPPNFKNLMLENHNNDCNIELENMNNDIIEDNYITTKNTFNYKSNEFINNPLKQSYPSSNNKEFVNKSSNFNANFKSTLSTIKGITSPIRVSLDDVSFRNTYSSPSRNKMNEEQYNRLIVNTQPKTQFSRQRIDEKNQFINGNVFL